MHTHDQAGQHQKKELLFMLQKGEFFPAQEENESHQQAAKQGAEKHNLIAAQQDETGHHAVEPKEGDG